jgi:hypothetical protein
MSAADFFKPRTTCWLSCKQPAVVSSLSSPPYKIHNGGFGFGRQAPLQSNIIHPTASECLQSCMHFYLHYPAHSTGCMDIQGHQQQAVALDYQWGTCAPQKVS